MKNLVQVLAREWYCRCINLCSPSSVSVVFKVSVPSNGFGLRLSKTKRMIGEMDRPQETNSLSSLLGFK